MGFDVYMECTLTRLLKDGDRIAGALGYWRESGRFVLFRGEGGGAVHRRRGQGVEDHVQLVGVHRRRPGARLRGRRRADRHGVRAVPSHRHGVAAWGDGPARRPKACAARAASCATRRASASCGSICPRRGATSTRPTRPRRGAGWRRRSRASRPRTGVRRSSRHATTSSRAIYTEVKEGRGSPHGGVFLDISYLPAERVKRKLPVHVPPVRRAGRRGHHQGPMEVGPTTHYMMGGIRVDPDTGAATVPGLFAAGESAGRHARRQPPRRQLAVGPAWCSGAAPARRRRPTPRALALAAAA